MGDPPSDEAAGTPGADRQGRGMRRAPEIAALERFRNLADALRCGYRVRGCRIEARAQRKRAVYQRAAAEHSAIVRATA